MTGITDSTDHITQTKRVVYSETLQSGKNARINDKHHTTQADPEMVLKNSELIRQLSESRPVLAKPQTTGVTFAEDSTQANSDIKGSRASTLTFLMLNIAKVTQKSGEFSIKINHDMLAKRNEAAQIEYNLLSAKYQIATNLADALTKAYEASKAELDKASEDYDKIKNRITDLTEKLKSLKPEDGEYKEVSEALEDARSQGKTAAQVLEQASSACTTAWNKAADAVSAADEIGKSLTALGSKFFAAATEGTAANEGKNKNAAAQLILLVTTLLNAISDNQSEVLKTQNKLSQELDKVRQARLEKVSKESEAKAKKASIWRRVISIVSGIAGALCVVFGLIAAIPTAGSGLAGGIGLGLAIASGIILVADVVGQIGWDVSLMGKGMEKLMEGVSFIIEKILIGWLFNLISSGDPDSLKNVKELTLCIVSSIVSIAIVITTALLTRKFVAAGIAKAGTTAAEVGVTTVNSAAKTVGSAVNVAADATKVAKDTVKVAADMSKWEKLANTLIALLPLCSGVMQLRTSILDKDCSELMGEFQVIKKDIDVIVDIRQHMLSTLEIIQENATDLTQVLSDVLQHRTDTVQSNYRRGLA